MKRELYALFAGGLFGVGLFISGMTETDKVQGWLDVFGQWDPTLAFVMGGAIIPMFFAWRYTNNRQPVLGGDFPAKPDPKVGRNLIIGSTLFGMGWGLAGLCPGPSIASLSYGGWPHWLFFAAMISGMIFAPRFRERLDSMVPAE
ncbi:YeeE/YedE family protein [Cognatishimia activa]|uniref:YeeE/YedE family protein n=1 Tax=Cognatishimia activa TaxID=1715691 RepID=UPI002232B42F|nr:YeeE/YedE family protein [Cognatishimia activa]UZD91679.1 YeeE/YedE family protein [Cognatishimia activa]